MQHNDARRSNSSSSSHRHRHRRRANVNGNRTKIVHGSSGGHMTVSCLYADLRQFVFCECACVCACNRDDDDDDELMINKKKRKYFIARCKRVLKSSFLTPLQLLTRTAHTNTLAKAICGTRRELSQNQSNFCRLESTAKSNRFSLIGKCTKCY